MCEKFQLCNQKTTNLIINDIKNFAIKNLKNDLKKLSLKNNDLLKINELDDNIKLIELAKDDDKLPLLSYFLLINYECYNKNIKSPLNTYYLNCGKIMNKYIN